MQSTFQHQTNLVGIFAQHKVAANLLMLMMLMAGIWGLTRLNIQFLPNFALDVVQVTVIWSGAPAEDVETSITSPIERELRTLDRVRKMNSTSANGLSAIMLEFEEHTDMGWALDQVKDRVSLLRNLPKTAEKPEIGRLVRYDPIARLLITGPTDPNELRHLAQQIERELLKRGISKINIEGLPEEEIAIQINSSQLEELGLSLTEVGNQIAKFSRDLPAGAVGRSDVARQLRSLEQRRSELAFTDLPLTVDNQGRYLKLGDVATIERRPQNGEVRLTYQGKPAVELQLMRAEENDALESAKVLQTWLAETQPKLPGTVTLKVYDESWELIADRINLLINNGLGGLILVVVTLFIFLNGRVAFWVAMGIPTSIMTMLGVLYLVGGSINMISLFAMIMALGVVVDDAIVVGEDAFTHFQMGERSLLAAEGGAQRMLAPVISASLTTMAAFLPLMFIGGLMGNILFDIPLVMICVLTASLIECFFVLPGHLRHTFHKLHNVQNNALRQKLEQGFDQVRDRFFHPMVTVLVEYRWAVFTFMLSLLALAISLLISGQVNFTFFPSPDGTIVMANANFVAGTPPERVDRFLSHLESTLMETEQDLGGDLIKMAVVRHGSSITEPSGSRNGDQFGSLMIELTSPDHRLQVRNKDFLKAWRAKIITPPGLENLVLSERKGGPPGSDIDIRLIGNQIDQVKNAALELKKVLETFEGVSGIEDDLPYGREQWIYSLTPEGMALGLTIDSVGEQLRAAFDGHLVQIFQEGEDEIEVRVSLPDEERYQLSSLDKFTLQLPKGGSVPFSTAVHIKTRRGFETVRHSEGLLAAQVSANVDSTVANSNKIIANLVENFFPELKQRYGVDYSFEGRAADQAETIGDMKLGLVFAVALMYLVLAWQFASYGWPLIVMSIIPFGLVGALFGHWVMGVDLTILSLFGFFGLSGVVVNDSIVLVTFYRDLRREGVPIKVALTEASRQRLRAVLLTSLTTIFGLLPILFETSLQAQFLIPMAISISFGLMFSTVLVLLAIPALMGIYERIIEGTKEWE